MLFSVSPSRAGIGGVLALFTTPSACRAPSEAESPSERMMCLVRRAGGISGIDIDGRDVVVVNNRSRDVVKPVNADGHDDIVENVDEGGDDVVEHVDEGWDGIKLFEDSKRGVALESRDVGVELFDDGMCGVSLEIRGVVEHGDKGKGELLDDGGSGIAREGRGVVAHAVDGRCVVALGGVF